MWLLNLIFMGTMMKQSKSSTKLYDKRNYTLLVIGVVVVILGYVALSLKPNDGIFTMNVAPVLLIVGYCVILPIALFIRPSSKVQQRENK